MEQKTENLGSNPSEVWVIGNFGQIRQMKQNIFRKTQFFHRFLFSVNNICIYI